MRRASLLPWPLFLGLAATAALVVGLHALRPAAPPHFSTELVGPSTSAVARQLAKGRVTADVIDGRLSLAEAIAAFRALDEDAPLSDDVRACVFPGATEEEAYRRMVLSWVEVNAPPDRADGLIRRLKAESDGRPWYEGRRPPGP